MNQSIRNLLSSGIAIPAHPLALTRNLKLDEFKQRRLTRYYLASGAGGVAVGVHTTQFEIREKGVDLLEPVLRLASEEIDRESGKKDFVKVAGVCGHTKQALTEAEIALKFGYHAGLVSLGGLNDLSEKQLVKHIQRVASIIPVFGFYLQPAVGGRILSYDFWRKIADIPNVAAIKVAPFNRYQTLDVIRAVCESSRSNEISLYTGNDDNIVADLLTGFSIKKNNKTIKKNITGGLLGHWAVWTHNSVNLFKKIKKCRDNKFEGVHKLLMESLRVTDTNAAIFDPVHSFRGSIAGIHEVLRRQGLLDGIWCLNPKEKLSKGQLEEIDRVIEQYPDLCNDSFEKKFLEKDKKKYGVK